MNKRDRKHKLAKRRFHSGHPVHQIAVLANGVHAASWYSKTIKCFAGLRIKPLRPAAKTFQTENVLAFHKEFNGHNGSGAYKLSASQQNHCLWFCKNEVILKKQ